MDFDSPDGSPDAPSPPSMSAARSPTLNERAVALLEVILCSDFPTQIALGATFTALGFQPLAADRSLQVGYVVALSLLDTVFLVGLMLLFLRSHGESPAEVFFGGAPIGAEIRRGLPLTLAALGIAAVVMLSLRQFVPWLHTVEHNPLQDLVRTRGDVLQFALVVVVAGGVREELQRAFLLRRFERWLGGTRVGLVVTSTAFGAGHFLQGADAAIATGMLGAFWAAVYLRRRSIVAPMVSHSGFNLLQLAQFLALGK
jgi:membrane protease YdiL (CAAX protease family)